MSAPAKEPQPLGSRSGKRGYIRICTICGRELRGVGSHTKYCPDCRAEVNRVRTRERSRRRYAADRDILTDLARNIISTARLYGVDSELTASRKPTAKED